MGKSNENEFLPVSKEEAWLHAVSSAARNIASGIPHLQSWGKAKVAATPLEIYDINGTLLFYDFEVTTGKGQVGTIRAAASKYLGNPVISYRLGPIKWDPVIAEKKISAIARKNFPGYKITNTLLVCYSYPKIGLMVTLSSAEKDVKKVIFDIADYSIIPERNKNKDIEGAFAWSFLDSLDEKNRKSNINRFDEFAKARTKLNKESGGIASLKKFSIDTLIDLSKFRFKLLLTKELQFCTHYNYNEPASHHCFVLHAQQVNDYCAVATCQMILCYFRYYYTQDQIAPALGYSPGGCPSDQSPGYKSLSNNHINSSFDTSPTWEKARDQINLLQPLKSGIPGHARACAGYSYFRDLFGIGLTEKRLYIYDPWPWNSDLKAGGDIYWEDWDSINHTNFVYTDLNY